MLYRNVCTQKKQFLIAILCIHIKQTDEYKSIVGSCRLGNGWHHFQSPYAKTGRKLWITDEVYIWVVKQVNSVIFFSVKKVTLGRIEHDQLTEIKNFVNNNLGHYFYSSNKG